MKTGIKLILITLISSAFINAQDRQAGFPELKGAYLGQKLPGKTSEIFAPGIVSSVGRAAHSPIIVSPDGTEIYWVYTMPFEIYYSKIINGIWTKPETVSFAKGLEATCLVMTPDGKKIFFTSQKIENKKFIISLWYVDRKENGWSEPKPADPQINLGDIGYIVSVTNNGTIYFVTGALSGKGGDDIYYSELVNGKYSAPKNIGDAINSPLNEDRVFVAPDESYIIFNRWQRTQSGPQMNYFISFRNKDGSWSKPVDFASQMGEKDTSGWINITPDGKYITYTSVDMPRRQYFYWREAAGIINSLKPKE
jgi:hypothetical protein